MAMDHYLDLETEMPADRLAEVVHGIASEAGLLSSEVPDSTPLLLLNSFGRLRRLMSLGVRSTRWQIPTVEELGISPTASVSFRDNLGQEPVKQEDDMVWLVLAVLSQVSGNAIFHYDFEVIWLLRRDGVLYVNDRDDYWTPTRLAMLPAHQRAHLAFA